MDYGVLKKNLISVLKESQIKLGYESVTMGVNYVTPSLLHLLPGIKEEDLQQVLLDFAKQNEDTFGEIAVRKTDVGYRLDVSPKGADYVHGLIGDDDFLVNFINEVRSPSATVDSIIAVFKKYSNNIHIEKTDDNPEFDYLIYFEDGTPDEFWYCIDTEDLGMTYHRFMKDDYLDFDF